MENKEKLIKIVVTLTTLAALSFFFTTHYRRRRNQKKCSRNTCYLHTDVKPQYNFKRVLADNSYSQFKHLKLRQFDQDDSSNSHPYAEEITALLDNPPLEIQFFPDGKELKMTRSYSWVETESQLKELADVLSKERVFAVDTEHHSLRSFLGFTALLQISTWTEDYLIDTIAVHDVMGTLRPVFSHPCICKVFHGADNDVLWLQRDFHLYVVNLFDTAKACDVLSKPQRSLAYLLETYCGVATNKLLQREDWRQRPLPEEMVQYARMDACYLLYIANSMFLELKHLDEESSCRDNESHFVPEAWRRSNLTCFQLYSKDIEAMPGESTASSIISRHLNGREAHETQFQEIVRRLCAWRDLMARVHDESLRFILSDQAIVAIADKVPPTPSDVLDTISQADMDLDSLNSSIFSPSPIVYSHLDHFHYVLEEKINNIEDIFPIILQKCLGQNGSCLLSVYNYSLLVSCTVRVRNGVVSKNNGVNKLKEAARKASRELFVQKFSCKSPVYHNCRIYANDGRLLCYCDRRKLEWYLRRDLAKLVDDDPPAIMLLFEPKGRPEDEGNEFYIQSKKNICVGCGEGNHYLRYRIIPSCYRMHFPEHLKSHRSHDIVLLCVQCHEIAHAAAEKYKRKIAAEFDIPLFVRNIIDSGETEITAETSESRNDFEKAGVSPLELRTAAMALIRHGQRMPSRRREELTQIVMRFYGGREISNDDLERALVVGMSSHERRRFEKKRGISSKHSKDEVPQKDQNESYNSFATSARKKGFNVSSPDGSCTMKVEAKGDPPSIIDIEVNNPNFLSTSEIREEAASSEMAMQPDVVLDANVHAEAAEDNLNLGSLPNHEVAGSRHDEENLPKKNAKLSLLGHGPHGKQVVDRILKDYGEDGIHQFCQRWRQVFVEAVHPRFLPNGWDIKHSGRRDFGEFSVYNPSKKSTATGKS